MPSELTWTVMPVRGSVIVRASGSAGRNGNGPSMGRRLKRPAERTLNSIKVMSLRQDRGRRKRFIEILLLLLEYYIPEICLYAKRHPLCPAHDASPSLCRGAQVGRGRFQGARPIKILCRLPIENVYSVKLRKNLARYPQNFWQNSQNFLKKNMFLGTMTKTVRDKL